MPGPVVGVSRPCSKCWCMKVSAAMREDLEGLVSGMPVLRPSGTVFRCAAEPTGATGPPLPAVPRALLGVLDSFRGGDRKNMTTTGARCQLDPFVEHDLYRSKWTGLLWLPWKYSS